MVNMTFRAQSYHIDFAGVVSNIAYLRWCEDLRLKLADELLPGWETGKYGHMLVVAETNIRYRRPAQMYDIFEVTCRILSAEDRFFVMNCDFIRAGELVATANQRCCFMDLKTGKAIALPAEFRNAVDLPGGSVDAT